MTEQAWFPEDIRRRAAEAIRLRRESLAADLDVVIGAGLAAPPAGDLRERLVQRTIDLLAAALSGTDLGDDRGIADFRRMQQAGLPLPDVFSVVRLAERAILHDLSVHPDLGATSDCWPAVTVIIRRASFDLLATLCERAMTSAGDLIDPVTMLTSRAVFDMALAKELQRAVRYHHPVTLVLLAVDNLALIRQQYGYGVSDLLMERLGVLMQRYFREPDWVSRYGSDAIAVLLPETRTHDAGTLADGARQAIEKRLVFHGEEERAVHVTASASVVTVTLRGRSSGEREAPDAARVMSEAEAAVSRARARGGNAIECVEVSRDSLSVVEAAARLHCSPATIRRLIVAGTLPGVAAGGRMRLDRIAVDAYGKRRRKG